MCSSKMTDGFVDVAGMHYVNITFISSLIILISFDFTTFSKQTIIREYFAHVVLILECDDCQFWIPYHQIDSACCIILFAIHCKTLKLLARGNLSHTVGDLCPCSLPGICRRKWSSQAFNFGTEHTGCSCWNYQFVQLAYLQ